MAPVFAYWKLRGLAQPIRLLLKYNNDEYEEKVFILGTDKDRSVWLKEKFSLGLDFPNLPYYIDGDIKITQSGAILRHIARKHDMCGTTEKERAIVDMLEHQLLDFRSGFIKLCYDHANFEANKPGYIENVKATIKAFADFLGQKTYLVGDKLTFVDFLMYELMDHHRLFEASLLAPHANLKAFLDRIEALPTIAAYMKSDQFISRPINSPNAAFT